MRFPRAAVAALFLAAVSVVSWAASPVLGFDDAHHLLGRATFAAAPDEIQTYAALTREQAVERLLSSARVDTVTPPPEWTAQPFEPFPRLANLSPAERQALQRDRRAKQIELKAWWLEEMRVTPAPLSEKMTLFWHNHFVSSEQKVRVPHLMYRQNQLLRRHALGRFDTLLHEIAHDPAMMIYLDGASNRKGQPNENFAREVMELFTLGEGHYTEQDVKEAARAFTGWGVDRERGEFVRRPFQHDDGLKTVLGRSGPLTGDDVLEILLAQPRTAEYIVEKLWREFVSPEPDRAQVSRIARAFRESGYEIRVALKGLLTSDAFYAPENRGSLIKSPVDLVVGTLRQFRFSTGEMLPFVFTLTQLGQNLFAPPNVKGWPGGEAWINTTTLLARKQFLARLFTDQVATGVPARASMGPLNGGPLQNGAQRAARALADIRFDTTQWFKTMPDGDNAALERVVLASAPGASLPPDVHGIEALRMLTQDPVYQLK